MSETSDPVKPSLCSLKHPALGSTRLLQLGTQQLQIQTEIERGRSLVTCVFSKGRVLAKRMMPLPSMTFIDADILSSVIKSEQRQIVAEILDKLRQRESAKPEAATA